MASGNIYALMNRCILVTYWCFKASFCKFDSPNSLVEVEDGYCKRPRGPGATPGDIHPQTVSSMLGPKVSVQLWPC